MERLSGAMEVLVAFLDARDVATCTCVSRMWKAVFDRAILWKVLCYQCRPSHKLRLLPPSSKNCQRAGRLSEWNIHRWKELYQGLVQTKLHTFDAFSLAVQGVYSSSCDDELSQGIDNTLDADSSTFWSSTGSESCNDIVDILIFRLRNGLCVINSVAIVPFRAAFQSGQPIYAPQALRVRVQLTQEAESCVFTSEWFDVARACEVQTFGFGDSLVIGGYVCLEMRGRCQTQPIDSLYYTCLETVCFLGVPLGVLGNEALDEIMFDECVSMCPCSTYPWSKNLQRFRQWLAQDTKQLVAQSQQLQRARSHLLGLVEAGNVEHLKRAVSELIQEHLEEESLDVSSIRVEVLRHVEDSMAESDTLVYLESLIEFGLNEEESLAYAAHYARLERPNNLDRYVIFYGRSIWLSERLGDLLYDLKQFKTALVVYSQCNVPEKFTLTMARLCCDDRIVPRLLHHSRLSDNQLLTATRVADILSLHHHPYILAQFVHGALESQLINLDQAEDLLADVVDVSKSLPTEIRARYLREYREAQKVSFQDNDRVPLDSLCENDPISLPLP